MSEPVAPREPTVSVVPSARGPESATYVLEGEDHTLGNALRYAIMRDEAVLFCGYSVPHPSEERLNLRVQVRPGGGRTAEAAFRRGLANLGAAAAAVSAAFSGALAAHDAAEAEAGAGAGAGADAGAGAGAGAEAAAGGAAAGDDDEMGEADAAGAAAAPRKSRKR